MTDSLPLNPPSLIPPSTIPLATIPLVEAGGGGAVSLLDADPDRLLRILDAAKQFYGLKVLKFGDRYSRKWLHRTNNPYIGEIEAVGEQVGVPGVYMLNLSFEWACTAGVGGDPARPGSRLVRTLDWALDGLGRSIIVARFTGPAGDYFNVTWPGFAGVLTAMAPGRFSIAINQPPLKSHTGVVLLDWAIARRRVWRRGGLPPTHLLRRVFDQCATYSEAVAMLTDTKLCIPAFFTVSGVDEDEGCVIERMENAAARHDAPGTVANHWVSFQVRAHPRGFESHQRWQVMERLRDDIGDDFAWVTPPILNEGTRLSVIANAKAGTLMVQGWENEVPATGVFVL